MADDELQKIITETTNLESYWKPRNEQMLIDRSLINLERAKPKTDQSNWVTNEPKVFFDTSRALVSIGQLRFRLPIVINYNPDQKEKMNKAERLCIGVLRDLNTRQADKGEGEWLWELAYWVLLGWYAVFSQAVKTKAGIKFIADIYDPMTVYPQWDSMGLARCARIYEVDKVTAIAMATDMIEQSGLDLKFYEPTDGGAKPRVINYWRREMVKGKPVIKNAILIAGQFVKPLTVQSKLTRIPIHVGAIGTPDKTSDNWMVRRGESIVAANRDVYEYTNVMIKLMAEILAATAYPNIVTKTISGQPAVKTEDVRGHGQVLPVKVSDTIDLLRHAATPEEANILTQYFLGQSQKGSLPNAVYGSIPVELSGFAISQLLAAIKYKLSPYLNTMQYVISRVFTDFLYQYRSKKLGKITLSTLNPYDLKRGMSYLEEFSHEDIPDTIYVEATIPITSQFDKTQAILNSVQALQAGLMSRETLWEQELDIQDSEQEKERIREDQVSQDPFVMDIEIIERMWARVEAYQAQGKIPQAEALKRYIMQKEMTLGMRQGIPERAGAPGVPPQQAPPEATMSPNPDQARAMVGKAPPPGDRSAQVNAGRKGALVSPRGEILVQGV